MIVFFTYTASSAGANKMTFLIARHLVKRGVKSMVICGEDGPLVGQYGSLLDIEILNKKKINPGGGIKKRLSDKIRYYNNYYKAGKLLKKIKPEVAYISNSVDYGYNKSILENKIKLVLHAQGISTNLVNSKKNNREYFYHSDHIISISDEVRNNIIFNFGVDPGKVTTVYNGIEPEEIRNRMFNPRFDRSSYGIEEDDFVISSAGTLCWQKGSDIFVDAAIRVLKRTNNPKIKFLWVGADSKNNSLPNADKGLRNVLEKIIKDEHLEKNIIFIPAINEPYDIYNLADMYVICSREEAFGLVIIENMLLGKPVIAFPIGGIPEVLRYGGGVFTEHISSDSLADTIINNLSAEKISSITRDSKNIVAEHFDINNQVKKIIEIFNRLA